MRVLRWSMVLAAVASIAAGCGQAVQQNPASVGPVNGVTAVTETAPGSQAVEGLTEETGGSYELLAHGGRIGGSGGRIQGGGRVHGGRGRHGGHGGYGGYGRHGGYGGYGGYGRHGGYGGYGRHGGYGRYGGYGRGWWGGGNWWGTGFANPWWGLGVQPAWWGSVPLTPGYLLAAGSYYFPFYTVGNLAYPNYSMPYAWSGATFQPVTEEAAPPPNEGAPVNLNEAQVVQAPAGLF